MSSPPMGRFLVVLVAALASFSLAKAWVEYAGEDEPQPRGRAAGLEDRNGDGHVVIAFTDTGINPYHPEFAVLEEPPSPGGTLDGPGVDHPSVYVSGYPADAPALALECQPTTNIMIDCPGDFREAAKGALYWIPGTKIIGAITIDGTPWGPTGILDDSGHGTAMASIAAGNTLGACRACLVVAIEGLRPQAVAWATQQSWIDIVSNSWGSTGDPQRAADEAAALLNATRSFVERGGTVLFAQGDPPAQPSRDGSHGDPLTGADWHLVVGAVDPDGHPLSDSGTPVTFSAPGSNLVVACHMNLTRNCRSSGASAATAFAAGAFGNALWHARRTLSDVDEGPRDALQGMGVAASGEPVAGNPYFEDGVLTRQELWTVLFRTTTRAPEEAPDSPGTSGGLPKAGYGVLDPPSIERAVQTLRCGTHLEVAAGLDGALRSDSQQRRQRWGDWKEERLAPTVSTDGENVCSG